MKKENFSNWFKKFGTYVISGGLVLAIGITIIAVGTGETKANVSEAKNPVVSVDTEPMSVLTFTLPMNEVNIVKDYSNDELFFNSTLGRWEFHNGIDLTSTDQKVFAVADGTVSKVYSDYANGTVIEIDHGNNLKSVYGSLSENVLVNVGDKVQKGTEIGTASTTATSEINDNAHLHFSFLENEKNVDPANYLDLASK